MVEKRYRNNPIENEYKFEQAFPKKRRSYDHVNIKQCPTSPMFMKGQRKSMMR